MRRRAAPSALVLTAVAAITGACGQKGPPLAPLQLVPAAVSELSVRRVSDRVRLRMVLPSRNENGPGRLELDRVDIYAMTIAAESAEPSARELLAKERLVGSIAVRPVLGEGEAAAPDDKRPEPGAAVTFDEELTAQKLTPVMVATPAPGKPVAAAAASVAQPAPAPPGAAPSPAPAAEAAPPSPASTAPGVTPAPKPPGYARRIYVARGITRAGRPGAVSTRGVLPLVPLPAPPQDVRAKVTENAVVLGWTAETSAGAYNVYRAGDLLQPVNTAPLKEPAFEHGGATLGEEQCYRIRAVTIVDAVTLEGEPSAVHCVTPRDQFPPAAPKGLAAVPTPGQINLIWDANGEKDLAGYLVLRGERADGPLVAITAAPIRETSYRDATVKPGVRYVYAIVAVDTARPPNTSAQSPAVEETAR